MHISEFNFELPSELIAQDPVEPRDHSRLLIVNRQTKQWQDRTFKELPEFLSANDVIVINNTRVFPARLLGHRIINGVPGAKVEALLTRQLSVNQWEAMAKPGRALPIGTKISFGKDQLQAEVIALLKDGRRILQFVTEGELDKLIDEVGNTPLPPYIKRDYDEKIRLDEPRYQTIYAKERGAIAAPTAGLHFTDRVFGELKNRGVEVIQITHHVGAATFQPVRTESVADHRIEAESYEIGESAAASINTAKDAGKRIIAVGTTTTRALESAINSNGKIASGCQSTELCIRPGYRFKVINALITNFHLPQSSLLILVSTLTGHDLMMQVYQHAVKARYRFYSYGDCMFIS